METLLIFFAIMIFLTIALDVEEPILPAIIIAGIISGSGDSDSEEEIDTVKRKPAIVTEEKINTASQKEIFKGLAEDETKIEWQDDNTKWNYHRGQTWEAQKNF